jgi:outer membrane receptor protein involved in Fe transport
LSLNTRYQLNQLLGLNKTKAITFSLFATNLLDEKFYYPAITAKSINTIPATPGRTLFGELAIEF